MGKGHGHNQTTRHHIYLNAGSYSLASKSAPGANKRYIIWGAINGSGSVAYISSGSTYYLVVPANSSVQLEHPVTVDVNGSMTVSASPMQIFYTEEDMTVAKGAY